MINPDCAASTFGALGFARYSRTVSAAHCRFGCLCLSKPVHINLSASVRHTTDLLALLLAERLGECRIQLTFRGREPRARADNTSSLATIWARP